MKSFLYVMVENIPVLMDGDAVYEILPLAEGTLREKTNRDSASGHLDWRNQLLPIVNARELFALPLATASTTTSTKEGAGVVYRARPDQPPIFLVVDKVVRILKLGLDAFVPLPTVPEKIRYFFDRVYMDADEGRQAYRFRNPLPDGVLTDVELAVKK